MDAYKQNYQIDYWPYPNALPDAYFSEGLRVNHLGAKKYEDGLFQDSPQCDDLRIAFCYIHF